MIIITKANGTINREKDNKITIRSSAAEYLTYVAATGSNCESIEMRYENENIWLTQKMMATLYDVETNTINYHIKKIFEDSELNENSFIRKFRITADDGKSYNTNHYNLQMIIAVGFKVNNERTIQFRKWAKRMVTSLDTDCLSLALSETLSNLYLVSDFSSSL